MTENEKAIKTFCDQFEPPLNYAATQRINNQPVSDAYTTAFWLEQECIGITVLSYGSGNFKAYIEAAGKGDIAESAGKVIARAFGLFKAPAPGSENLPEAYRGLKFDGFDALDDDQEKDFAALYRAACLKVSSLIKVTDECSHEWTPDGTGGAVCDKCGRLVTVPDDLIRLLKERDDGTA
jgi:hypothetical protein